MIKTPAQGHESPAAITDGTAATTSSATPPWLSVIKVSATDWSIAAGDLACLLERNLLQRTGRVLRIDPQGRIVLGVPV